MHLINTATNGLCRTYGVLNKIAAGHDVILCYHSVRDRNTPPRGWISERRSVDASLFESQMQWLKRRTEVVPLADLVSTTGRRGGVRVAVTFDDGYLDNAAVAMPIMRRLGLPMTWFINTSFVDNPHDLPWWDLIDFALEHCNEPLHVVKSEIAYIYDLSTERTRNWFNRELRNLLKSATPERRDRIVSALREAIERQKELPVNAFARPQEIARATADGLVEIGGHTATHPNVAACADQALTAELDSNVKRLRELTRQKVEWFAYPFGGHGTFNKTAADTLEAKGYSGAVTLVPGVIKRQTDRYKIPRIPIAPSVSLATFKARVAGAPVYAALERVRTATKRLPSTATGTAPKVR